MSHASPFSVSCSIHFGVGRRGRKKIETEPAVLPPPSTIPGTIPRVSRVMALAIHFDELIRAGEIRDYTDLAGLTDLSRPRITQIMNLLHLAPDIQEEILFLPRTVKGRDPIVERDLWPIEEVVAWKSQRTAWHKLSAEPSFPNSTVPSADPQRVPFSNRRTMSESVTPSALQTSPSSARSRRRSPDS